MNYIISFFLAGLYDFQHSDIKEKKNKSCILLSRIEGLIMHSVYFLATRILLFSHMQISQIFRVVLTNVFILLFFFIIISIKLSRSRLVRFIYIGCSARSGMSK